MFVFCFVLFSLFVIFSIIFAYFSWSPNNVFLNKTKINYYDNDDDDDDDDDDDGDDDDDDDEDDDNVAFSMIFQKLKLRVSWWVSLVDEFR